MQGTQEETVVASLIRAIGTADFMPALLTYMRGAIGFSGAFVVSLTKSAGPDHIYDTVRAERRSVVVDRWLDAAWALDPYVQAYLQDEYEPVMTVDMVAPDRFSQSDYYRTYYGALRLRDELALFVTLGEAALFFSLGRNVGERRFTRRDVTQLRQAHPIIAATCEQHFFNRRPGPGTLAGQEAVIGKIGGDLSAREQEVVGLILRGHSTRSVAQKLGLSVETVRVHRRNIYRKLGISSQSALFSLFLTVASDG